MPLPFFQRFKEMNQVARIGDNNPPSELEHLPAVLSERYQQQLEHAAALVVDSQDVPPQIADEETAGLVADYVKQVTDSFKAIEALRVAEKAPHLAAERAVDGYFKPVTDALNAAKRKALKPLDDYAQRKADAERRRRAEEADLARKKEREEAELARKAAAANQPATAAAAQEDAQRSAAQAQVLEKAAAKPAAEMSRVRGSSGALASVTTRWVGEITDFDTLDRGALLAFIPREVWQQALNAYVSAGGRSLAGAVILEKQQTVVR